MPALETLDRYQTALLWPFTGNYDNFGTPIIDLTDEPQEVQVRWTNKKSRVMDSKGNAIMLDATAVVDFPVLVDSLMWLGTLAEWNGESGSSSGSNASDDDLMVVKTYSRWPDIKNRNIRQIVGLMRYKNTLSNG